MEKSIMNHPAWSVAVHASIEFDTIERLIILGQKALNLELDELHKAMDEDYKNLESENEEGDYLAHVNDEYIEVAETLPYLYWYSQFLIAFSFFERALDALCISLQKQHDKPLSFKDISGQGITRAKTYLIKVCSITTPFDLSEWQQANLFSEIRNSIVHKNGFIDHLPDDKRSLYYRLNQRNIELKSDIADQEDARIILTRDLVLESIRTYRVIIAEVGGLGRDFITPKHGTPSGNKKK